MEIVDNRKTTIIEELRIGDIFTLKPLSRTIYMLIQAVDKACFTNGNLQAVELSTGKIIFVRTNTIVYPTKAKVYITD